MVLVYRQKERKKEKEIALTLVILTLISSLCGEVFYGRVALDAILAAELLLDSAVSVADEDRRGILVLHAKFVPIGLHTLAVSSPRGEELNKGSLSTLLHLCLKVAVREDDRALCRGRRDSREHDHGS